MTYPFLFLERVTKTNVMSSLMENFDIAREALKTSLGSAGSAEKELEKYSQSLEFRLNSLKATWQGLAQTVTKTDFLKGGIDLLKGLVTIIDKLVKSLGVLGTVGLGTSIFTIGKHFKNLNAVPSIMSRVTNAFKMATKYSGSFSTGIKASWTALGRMGAASTAATIGISALVTILAAGYSAFKNMKEAESQARQETIESSNSFLDSAKTFEQAYIKYSGKSFLTTEEENELAGAIDGTIEALDGKSTAMSNVVNASDDYVANLERIMLAERKTAKEIARDKELAAQRELTETSKGWFAFDGGELDILIDGGKELEIAQDVLKDYVKIDNYRTDVQSIQLDPNASAKEVVEYYNALKIYKKELEDTMTDNELLDSKTYGAVKTKIDSLTDSVNNYVSGTYDMAKASKRIPKTLDEYLKTRKEIISEVGGDFATKQQTANWLDNDYGSMFDLSSVEAQARKFQGIIKHFGDGTVDGTNEIGTVEAFLNMRTAVNNNECTVGEYMSQLDDVETMMDGWSDEEKEAFNLEFGIDTDSVKEQYNATLKDMKKVMSEDAAKDFLNGLNASELQAFFNLKGKIDWENQTPDQIMKMIEEEAKRIEATSFTINLELEAQKLENLGTAIQESLSGAGIGTETMSAVEDMFGSLDSYDQSTLFERTSNGIRLNREELSRLNNEYKSTNVDALNDKMSALGDEYNKTKEELYSLTYGTDEYNTKANELSGIEQQIRETETLMAQYEGLASAYQQWQRTESSGNERDMYENVLNGFKTVKDELSRGWADDGTVEFLELITGRTDLASKSGKELKKVYDDLDETIKDTSYSVRDFFTVDDDGNSTSKGVYNFLDAVGQLEEEKFGGKDVVKRDDNGNVIGFDFQLVGGDKAIADALGISEELVQIMVRAADDAGFVVSMDGTYQQLDVLKEKAQGAAEVMNNALEKSGKRRIDIDFNTKSVTDIKSQLNSIMDIFDNGDGSINMELKGSEEALIVASTLQSMLDKLQEPTYMKLETNQVEKEMQTPLSKLQEYERLTQTEHQLKLNGTDTSELEKDKNEILNYFDELQESNPELAARLKIQELSRDELEEKINKGELKIPATVDIQMEMNDNLSILANKALLDAGIISQEEYEKRVSVILDVDVEGEEEIQSTLDSLDEKDKKVAVEFINDTSNFDGFSVDDKRAVIEYVVDHEEVNEYTPEKKEALVKYIADTNELDEYTPEQKEAIVEYGVNGGSIEEYEPEEKDAIVRYAIEHKEVDDYTPEEKEEVVKFVADSLEVEGYKPKEKKAIAKYLVNSDEVEKFKPKEKKAIAKYVKDTAILDSYTPEEKEAIVSYKKESTEVDNYTPAEKQAIAKYLADTGEPDSYTPDEKKAIAKFKKDTTEVDNWSPEKKTAVAKYMKDTAEVDNWNPKDKKGIAEYIKDVSDVTGWNPPRKEGSVVYRIVGVIGNIANKVANVFGGGGVNGTAHVDGTAFANGTVSSGKAYKQGSWGTKKDGTALMGELGTETIVRDGRFFTVGDNGAGFYKYKRGDIIFNHKQTEELFKYGKVTSGNGRGRALVSGTAFAHGSEGNGGGFWENSYGSSSSKPSSSSNSYTLPKQSYKPKDTAKDTAKDVKEEFEEVIDWIERAIQKIEREIDSLGLKANSVFKTWGERTSALTKEISKVRDEIELQEKARAKYLEQAGTVDLSSTYKRKIKNGEIDIETIKDEKLKEKIDDYQQWIDKARDAEKAIEELKETEAELFAQRFENVKTQYDGILGTIEHEKNMIDEYINQSEAQGWMVSEKYYQALSSREKNTIKQLEAEKKKLISELQRGMTDGAIKKGSEKW